MMRYASFCVAAFYIGLLSLVIVFAMMIRDFLCTQTGGGNVDIEGSCWKYLDTSLDDGDRLVCFRSYVRACFSRICILLTGRSVCF